MEKYVKQIKEKINAGQALCTVAVSLADPAVSELIGLSGSDVIWIEGEHGALGFQELQQHMIGAHAGGAAALVRLRDHSPSLVKPVLDMGPDIICFPTINTVADAEAVVRACSYPPAGVRGCNPQRASYYGRMSYTDYVQNANQETMIMVVIEQQQGYNNLADIVQVPGIDLIALGPGDLSLDMGFGGDMARPEIAAMIEEAVNVCKKYHKPFALFPAATQEAAHQAIAQGASMLVFSQDTIFISRAVQEIGTWCEKC